MRDREALAVVLCAVKSRRDRVFNSFEIWKQNAQTAASINKAK